MAYVGAAPANRVLSSADIAQGSVTLDDINFTDQPANMDISGTINKHTMRLADGVTVTGDVTISDDLVLSKLSDDGNAITLTNDSSTRTITGSGSIEASTLAQTPNASLTGMTGTIGSGVTGSPAIALTNATGQRSSSETYAQWKDENGYGSTDTKIWKFATEQVASNNTVVTVAQTAENGMTITANMDCYLYVSLTMTYSSGGRTFGLSKNATALTTNIYSISDETHLTSTVTVDNGWGIQVSCMQPLSSGDIVRPHSDGGAFDTSAVYRQKITILAIKKV